jgi:hypothetical protein
VKNVVRLLIFIFTVFGFSSQSFADMRIDARSKVLLIQTLRSLQEEMKTVVRSRQYWDQDTIKSLNDVQRTSLALGLCHKLSFFEGKFDLIDEMLELDPNNRIQGEDLVHFTSLRSGLSKCAVYSQILRDDVRNYTPKFGVTEMSFLVGTQKAAFASIEKLLIRLEQLP